MALLELESLISFNAMYAGTGPGLTEFYSLLMKKVSFKLMDLSYWISVSVPRDLTSLSLLGSLQRIFSSFVYTEKTSNGETEVQQVSNKSFLCRACVCVRACLPGHACLCAPWTVPVMCRVEPSSAEHMHQPSEEKGAVLKFCGCCLIGFEVLCLFFHLSVLPLSFPPLSLSSHLPLLTMWAHSFQSDRIIKKENLEGKMNRAHLRNEWFV